jgi:hypothetical protein
VVGAHPSLYGNDRAIGVHNRLTLGKLTHKALALLRKRDHRRSRPAPLRTGDDRDVIPLLDRHAAIGGAKVDSYYFSAYLCHVSFLPSPEKQKFYGI